jgi:glycosyltransferase XagB
MTTQPPKIRFGELLVKQGLITPSELEEALQLQEQWQRPLGEIIVAKGYIKNLQLAQTLANHFTLPFVNLQQIPIKKELIEEKEIENYLSYLFLPIDWEQDHLTITCASPSEDILKYLEDKYKVPIKLAVTSKFDIIWLVAQLFEDSHIHHATRKLLTKKPEHSASITFTNKQLFFSLALISMGCFSLLLNPIFTLHAFLLSICLIYIALIGFRMYLVWLGVHINDRRRSDLKKPPPAPLTNEDLPIYTILVPLFHERETLAILAGCLKRLDYPLAKLDIKLIFEENDPETIAYAKTLKLEEIFEFIVVPYSFPQSKPKALNYALRFARGELVTIYDAEDKPEPDQLKKVVSYFKSLPDSVVCLQAKLNFFNAHENILSRMFTLDYSIWFDYFLPALDALRIPIPLGGTSNHFKISVLRSLHSWDPHNVTEDADLGVRISALGLNVSTIASTTYEEATIHIKTWIKQRSRWIKGYMQTWLVHMRTPIVFYKTVGARAFWGFQLFVGGTAFVTLVNPILWGSFIAWLMTKAPIFDEIFSGFTLTVSFISLVIGNGLGVYVGFLSNHHRKIKNLGMYSLIMPFYWVLQSLAGIKAAIELVRNPFHWHKTPHGLTKLGHLDK